MKVLEWVKLVEEARGKAQALSARWQLKMIATHGDILKRVRLLIQRLHCRGVPAERTCRNARKARIVPGKLFAQSSGQRSPTLCSPAYAWWTPQKCNKKFIEMYIYIYIFCVCTRRSSMVIGVVLGSCTATQIRAVAVAARVWIRRGIRSVSAADRKNLCPWAAVSVSFLSKYLYAF